MLSSLERLIEVLNMSPVSVYRDSAIKGAEYPYIVYEFVNDRPNFASNSFVSEISTFQVSYITEGVEAELVVLKNNFRDHNILHSGFSGGPYDENNVKVTQFNTYVRCRNE